MITVQKFCCCLRLELGGLVLGGLTFIVNSLVFLYAAYRFIISCTLSCTWYPDDYMVYENSRYYVEACEADRRVSIGISVMTMLLCIGIAYISFIFMQGTRARNHKRVMPMLILLGVALVFSASAISIGIIDVLHAGFRYIWHVGTLIIASGIVLNVYSFVVVYSLNSLFRREHKTGDNPNSYQVQYAAKV